MATNNAVNANTSGVQTLNATTGVYTASSTTQYDVLVGAANNLIGNVGPGTAGQVLQSGGASANPAYSTATFPGTATGTGTILRADGTNWVATTATYPTTTTANQLLVSTATNVVGGVTAGTTGTVLTGVTGAVPAFSATPTVTSISFGGTALSNYAEGTFTPTLIGGSTAGTTVYFDQTGYYTRIGNMVTVYFSVGATSTTGTGVATFGGLPFTIKNQSTYLPLGTVYYNPNGGSWTFPASMVSLVALGTSNTNTFTMYGQASAQIPVQLSIQASRVTFLVQLTYFI